MLTKSATLCLTFLFANQVKAINYIIVDPFDPTSRAYLNTLPNKRGKLCARHNGVMTCFKITILSEEKEYITFNFDGTTYNQQILNRSLDWPDCYMPEVMHSH